MKKLVNLSICSFILTSCITTPHLREPNIITCVILSDRARCVDRMTDSTEDIPLEELTGFIAVSPEDYTKVKNHHDAVHTELNKCLTERPK